MNIGQETTITIWHTEFRQLIFDYVKSKGVELPDGAVIRIGSQMLPGGSQPYVSVNFNEGKNVDQ